MRTKQHEREREESRADMVYVRQTYIKKARKKYNIYTLYIFIYIYKRSRRRFF